METVNFCEKNVVLKKDYGIFKRTQRFKKDLYKETKQYIPTKYSNFKPTPVPPPARKVKNCTSW